METTSTTLTTELEEKEKVPEVMLEVLEDVEDKVLELELQPEPSWASDPTASMLNNKMVKSSP